MCVGICVLFRLFNVAPETTARFSRICNQSRSLSPPCVVPARTAPEGTAILPFAPPAPVKSSGHDPSGVALGDGVALVVALATPSEGQIELGLALVEVDRQGDQGQALASHSVAEVGDLALVEEQL